jgi:hypothetical protein
MLLSWDLLNSSSKTVGLTFFSGKITQFWYYGCLLLVSVSTTPKRQLKVSRIIAFVLGL